nr:Transmembrane protein [Ipomoea batatas]
MNTMMDLYGSEAIETTSTKPNKYPLCYLKKALQFLVPLSLLILSSYNFHFSHALERKYMFLIWHGGALKVEADDEKGGGAEELNRRVEEFIRKMKEEIRIEAKQQHLIAV